MKEFKMNAAEKLLAHLGVYGTLLAPAEEILELERNRAKRRTRPMIGRGKYGRNLMSHFDDVAFQKKLAKQIRQLKKAA